MTFNHFHPAQPASREGAALPHPARSVAPYTAILAATGALAVSGFVTERWAVALAVASLIAGACAGTASWLRRIQLCDLADRFIALGSGAPPPAAVLRERRSVLVSAGERRVLARSVRGLLSVAQAPLNASARVPVDRRAVLADAALLARLADGLDAVSTPSHGPQRRPRPHVDHRRRQPRLRRRQAGRRRAAPAPEPDPVRARERCVTDERCRSDRPHDRLHGLHVRRDSGIRASVMAASDIFGLVVSILLFVYLCYALFRGENL